MNKFRKPIMVCYIEIGNLAPKKVPSFMKETQKNIKKGLSKKDRKKYIMMYIPTRGNKSSKIEIL